MSRGISSPGEEKCKLRTFRYREVLIGNDEHIPPLRAGAGVRKRPPHAIFSMENGAVWRDLDSLTTNATRCPCRNTRPQHSPAHRSLVRARAFRGRDAVVKYYYQRHVDGRGVWRLLRAGAGGGIWSTQTGRGPRAQRAWVRSRCGGSQKKVSALGPRREKYSMLRTFR